MELRHLKLVDMIAREGNLSKAGKKLHLTQSALSHQLKALEEELGTALFDRLNKRLVLTRAGQIVLNSAGEILGGVKQLEKNIQEHLFGNVGEINLSTECYTCYRWLPEVMSVFKDSYPNVQINIFPEYTYQSLDKLFDGSVDLVITDVKPDQKGIAYQKLFSDDIMVVVSKNHPWTQKAYVEARDFENQVLITYTDYENTVLYQFLERQEVRPQQVMVMRLTESAIELVQHGIGVKGMATWALRSYLDTHAVTALPVGKNGLKRDWYVAYRKNADMKPHFTYFLQHLKQHLQQLPL